MDKNALAVAYAIRKRNKMSSIKEAPSESPVASHEEEGRPHVMEADRAKSLAKAVVEHLSRGGEVESESSSSHDDLEDFLSGDEEDGEEEKFAKGGMATMSSIMDKIRSRHMGRK